MKMTAHSRQRTQADSVYADDCVADPVPALWDEYDAEPGTLDRFWLPISAAIIAGWGGISYGLYSAFGAWALGFLGGLTALAALGAIAIVRAGSRGDEQLVSNRVTELFPQEQDGPSEQKYRQAA